MVHRFYEEKRRSVVAWEVVHSFHAGFYAAWKRTDSCVLTLEPTHEARLLNRLVARLVLCVLSYRSVDLRIRFSENTLRFDRIAADLRDFENERASSSHPLDSLSSIDRALDRR